MGISVAGVVATVVLLFGQLSASAAPSITVTPTTGLTNGQSITVSGAGFTGPIGGITECNTAANEPTVAFLGQQVPVGCTAPKVVPPTGGGFSNQSFTVKEGTVGPPGPGTDSAGHDAAADAALYPCPPTAAQAAAGAVCAIAYGTGANDSATQTITFQSAATTTGSSGATGATAATAAPASTATSAAAATTAPTTAAATALPATVQGTQATAADVAGQPPAGQVARTGPGTFLAALAVAGVVVLDLGYLTLSSTWTPRRLARQRA